MARKRYSRHYLEEWLDAQQLAVISDQFSEIQKLTIPDSHKAWIFFLLAYRSANSTNWRLPVIHTKALVEWDNLRERNDWNELSTRSMHLLQELKSKEASLFRLSSRLVNAFWGWAFADWKLLLIDYIPSVKEMLEVQKEGKRYVSLLFPKYELSKEIGERNIVSFFIHDMIHADHFFSNSEMYHGQVSFYQELSQVHVKHGESLNSKWQDDWNYLISDMNGHPTYLRQVMNHLLKTK